TTGAQREGTNGRTGITRCGSTSARITNQFQFFSFSDFQILRRQMSIMPLCGSSAALQQSISGLHYERTSRARNLYSGNTLDALTVRRRELYGGKPRAFCESV